MKINELITKLQAIEKEHGNVEIYALDTEGYMGDWAVTDIVKRKLYIHHFDKSLDRNKEFWVIE